MNNSQKDTFAMDEQFCTFPEAHLREFTTAVFRHFGVGAADAALAADVLVKSDLRGIDSHGVARLHTYFEMLELGRINPKPNLKIVREKKSVATVDGEPAWAWWSHRKLTRSPSRKLSSMARDG
jgi:LDH2 family malate/lactate/ureidoglycolate dehydrogenase